MAACAKRRLQVIQKDPPVIIRTLLSRAAVLSAALALVVPGWAHASEEWGYAHGTEQWGYLDDDFHTCTSGLKQSPIDVIRGEAVRTSLPSLHFDYARHTTLDVANLGHTVQAAPAGTGNTLRIGHKTYTLLQFHVHTPSENFLDGEQYPLELHLVHRAGDGSLAVVGVFFDEGPANAQLQNIINVMPDEEGDHGSANNVRLDALIPSGPLYRFTGSLTTPPCSENVAWHVASHRKTASIAQLAAFSHLYSGEEFPAGNRRPVQPLHGRKVYTAR